jgi:hypothetical protein
MPQAAHTDAPPEASSNPYYRFLPEEHVCTGKFFETHSANLRFWYQAMDLTLSSLAAGAAAAPEFFLSLIITSILILFVPWKANHKPLNALLNSPDSKKDALTKTWREQKISELTSVGVAVIHSPSTLHLPPVNISPVCHPRQHRHRCNILAL